MSSDDSKVWVRDLERGKKESTLENTLNWMTTEMKSRMKEPIPLRNQERRSPSGTSSTSDMQNTTGTNASWVKLRHIRLTRAQSCKL